MTRVIVPVHRVIMSMDVISPSPPKQVRVDTLVMIIFHKFPMYTQPIANKYPNNDNLLESPPIVLFWHMSVSPLENMSDA